MCGICGYNWEDKKLIKRMMKTLVHRGPDSQGYFLDSHMTLGHLRLSIIDISKNGRQPMLNEEGDVHLIYNGEIYNYKELRRKLISAGHEFKSETDSEVVLHAYEEYGEKCVQEFNGIFAFAIWDATKKQLLLARDKMGVKPLYYYYKNKKLLFASEIKAILEYDLEKKVDKEAFDSFMSFRFVPGEKTMFEGIKRVLPGHYMILKNDKLVQIKYWDVKENIKKSDPKELRKLLKTSVEMQLVSDVPLGVFLSGGIDSSTIVALMKESTSNIKTFSVGFEENSELNYAKKVADYYNTDHHELIVNNVNLDTINKMVYHLEEPIGDAATIPTMLISKFAKKKVTVVLAGEGSDEQFAGYDRYKMMLYGDKISKLVPNVIKNSKIKGINFQNVNLSRIKDLVFEKEEDKKYLKAISLFSEKEKKYLEVNKTDYTNNIMDNLFNNNKMKILNKLLYFDQKTLLPDDFFMKADKMTMAYSIEERVPFLDHRIVEYSFTVPTMNKLRGYNEKYILKQAMKKDLPKEIIQRRKRGYNAPMNLWLKELKGEFLDLLDSNDHSFYNKQKAKQMLEDFQKSKGSYKKNWFKSQQLWSLAMFELWHKRFISDIS